MHKTTIKSRSGLVSNCLLQLEKCQVGGNGFKCQGGRLVIINSEGGRLVIMKVEGGKCRYASEPTGTNITCSGMYAVLILDDESSRSGLIR